VSTADEDFKKKATWPFIWEVTPGKESSAAVTAKSSLSLKVIWKTMRRDISNWNPSHVKSVAPSSTGQLSWKNISWTSLYVKWKDRLVTYKMTWNCRSYLANPSNRNQTINKNQFCKMFCLLFHINSSTLFKWYPWWCPSSNLLLKWFRWATGCKLLLPTTSSRCTARLLKCSHKFSACLTTRCLVRLTQACFYRL